MGFAVVMRLQSPLVKRITGIDPVMMIFVGEKHRLHYVYFNR